MRRLIFILLVASTATVGAQSHKESPEESYKALVEKALDYTLKDSLHQAEQLYQQALKLDPSNARNALLFSNLGTVQRRLGKIDEAIRTYSMALNITPYATTILNNRAGLYMEQGLWDKAYVDYCNVIDLLPDNKEARLFRAYIYMRRRAYEEARIDYNVIIGKDLKNKPARIGLAMLDQKEKKYAAAADGLNQLIADYPHDASLLKMRANIEMEQSQWEAALLDMNQAIALDDKDVDSYLTKGDICLQLRKKNEAREAYERAIALGASRAELVEQLKRCK